MTNRRVATPSFTVSSLCSGPALSDLVHRLVHEVDNPLTAIISLATILERFDFPTTENSNLIEKHSSYARAISREAWRISLLLERLLLIASMRASANEFSNLTNALFENLAKIRDRDDYDQLQVNIEVAAEPLYVQMDAERLDSLITELYDNAHFFVSADLKSSPPANASATPAINVRLEDHRGWLKLDITNRLSKPYDSELSRFFEPFIVGDANHKRPGLGLTFVATIVERAGGRISIEQELHNDCVLFTTTIWLPCHLSSQLLTGDSDKSTQLSQQNALRLGPGRNLSVLVIEDEQMVSSAIAKILELSLKTLGNVSCLCVSGTEAVERLKAGETFDCILCDLNLAGMSGRHILAFLHERRSPLVDRFVFLTGDSLSSETKLYLQSCHCPYLFKPFEPDTLSSLVRSMLGKAPPLD